MHLTYRCLQKIIPPILNLNLPSCINCAHFIHDKTNKNDEKYGKCKLFGKKNTITGEIKYIYALYCRDDYEMCGKYANLYVSKLDDIVK
jgi:hypothetical protein